MSVSKDSKSGKWQIQCWYRNWQGERKLKHKRGFDTRRAAVQWEREFMSIEQGQNVSMQTLIDAFIKDMHTKVELGNLKPSTVYTKTNNINRYIKPSFLQENVNDIRTSDINEWIADLNKKNHYHERMASSTVNTTRNLLSQIFEYGIRHFGVKSNPVKSSEVVRPFTNDKRVKVWSLEQYQTFYASLTSPRHQAIFNTLFFAGLRIGELLALTPQDITDHSITVNKTMTLTETGKDDIGTPKRLSSEREVAIPTKLAAQLQEYISKLEGIQPTDRIFDINVGTVRSFLRYRCKILGLPHISPHILRHSYASIFLHETNDIAVVSYQIGHKSPATTLSVYSHMVPGTNIEQVKKLDEIIKV